LCRYSELYGVQWELSAKFSRAKWYEALTIASIAGYSFIALAIYSNKSLQAHPMRLIFYISIVDAALCCNLYNS
jgi:hypothetical protein